MSSARPIVFWIAMLARSAAPLGGELRTRRARQPAVLVLGRRSRRTWESDFSILRPTGHFSEIRQRKISPELGIAWPESPLTFQKTHPTTCPPPGKQLGCHRLYSSPVWGYQPNTLCLWSGVTRSRREQVKDFRPTLARPASTIALIVGPLK